MILKIKIEKKNIETCKPHHDFCSIAAEFSNRSSSHVTAFGFL